ncbi:hypothetical protein P0D88_26495 [Paraburkholderia sp. RL18-103-BIB-C]|jgi:hypothetical protein|uniref:hypothetical protein n=1 Tax=unclassified Paraburkholderia TaxID=2615204 RepID=UPI0038BCA384
MSVANRRASSARLSLVLNKLSAAAIPARREATTAEPMPQGWFDEEVGYIGETPAGARFPAHSHRD